MVEYHSSIGENVCKMWRWMVLAYYQICQSQWQMDSSRTRILHVQTIHSRLTMTGLQRGFWHACYSACAVTITTNSVTKCKVVLPPKSLPIIKGP